jgi:transcriptional regulator with XRE-family HTH domain
MWYFLHESMNSQEGAMKGFGQWLQREMAQRGLRIVDLSKLCGVSQPTISRWLSGQIRPLPDSLRGLADALGLPYAEVMHVSGYSDSAFEEPVGLPAGYDLVATVNHLSAAVAEVVPVPVRTIESGQTGPVICTFYTPEKMVAGRRISGYLAPCMDAPDHLCLVFVNRGSRPNVGDLVVAWNQGGGVVARLTDGRGKRWLESATDTLEVTPDVWIEGTVTTVTRFLDQGLIAGLGEG